MLPVRVILDGTCSNEGLTISRLNGGSHLVRQFPAPWRSPCNFPSHCGPRLRSFVRSRNDRMTCVGSGVIRRSSASSTVLLPPPFGPTSATSGVSSFSFPSRMPRLLWRRSQGCDAVVYALHPCCGIALFGSGSASPRTRLYGMGRSRSAGKLQRDGIAPPASQGV